MYCVLDIESTGGDYGKEGIMEIAIYRTDGNEIFDQFISLINPQREIHFYVRNLTGITQKMVKTAPKFHELAKRIIEITEDCILVGHDVQFDYRMLRQEFSRLGYDYQRKTLDTLEMSQVLMPEQETYSLGKLTKALGIPLLKRHRADGDAKATYHLLRLLLEKDSQKSILNRFLNDTKKSISNTHLLDLIKELPNATGVYYFHDKDGEVIYVGKSRQIKQRVTQHFTGKSKKSIQIQAEVEKISYQITGSELVALLKESHEIRCLQPKINVQKKTQHFPYALAHKTDEKGYEVFEIRKSFKTNKPLLKYQSLRRAKNSLLKIIEKHELCESLNGLDRSKPCFKYGIEKCKGACIEKEKPDEYNLRVHEFMNSLQFPAENFWIQDKGRNKQEKSFVLILDGEVYGYGFYEFDHQTRKIETLKKLCTVVEPTNDMRHLVVNSLLSKGLKWNAFKE